MSMFDWEIIYNADGDVVGHRLNGKFYYPSEFEKLFEKKEK